MAKALSGRVDELERLLTKRTTELDTEKEAHMRLQRCAWTGKASGHLFWVWTVLLLFVMSQFA